MEQKILIVDDVEMNRELLAQMLQHKYTICMAQEGQEAVDLITNPQHQIEVILLDLVMPGRDGFYVLEEMQRRDLLKKIPVLIISGDYSVETQRKCFQMGAVDFIQKPFDPVLVINRVERMSDLYQYKNQLEQQVQNQTAAIQRQYKMLQFQTRKLQESNEKILEIFGTVVEYRSLDQGNHIKRVKTLTRILADRLRQDYPEYRLTEQKVQVIASASVLHDIGKLAIPDSILMKPARLTREEYDYMRSHTTRGCEILEQMEGVWDEEYQKTSIDICRYHHERYDGNGYPDGLKGEKIPISAQLVSITDAYDTMVNESLSKNSVSPEEAFRMILEGERGVFSPKILECFRRVQKEFQELEL